MHFLNEIDKLKAEKAKNDHIKQWGQFYFYEKIKPDEGIKYKRDNQFSILKRWSTNILIENGKSGIKVYLSDYDIIKIIVLLLDENKDIGDYIISSLINFIEGSYIKWKFKIQEKSFEVSGIPFIENGNIYINTKADFSININEFIVLLNLVIEKERISGENIVQGTICKYVILSKYYSKYCNAEYKSRAEKLLREHEFNCEAGLYENKIYINKRKKNKKIKIYEPKLLIPYSKFIEYNLK